ncbi:transcriptional activator [Thermodesulfovibrio yellowstonii DSM 11347]|jgi:two-component system response regulator FlrC|uniref:Transcriptional activator n=1 Tax=Thermodesulfovibrio yellowstonii (strain ATCC 51303 / DSM 11347 / YP87) TaxID=289376 RepID=B5YI45_THEYD|nr:transcriptional activator [Thermodesulfovibrio yellowstonii DSM 11347]MDI6864666.1 sigma-54 dependent transcriptional regulator [Thermodesulfovibrio yellowstonii]
MKSVLIIDDEPDMGFALKEGMSRLGFDAHYYRDPSQLLSNINFSDFSLIITDVKMPKMDGLQLLEEIRKRGIFTPVIVITGYGNVEDAVRAMKLGAVDYIMKPFSMETLKSLVSRLIPEQDEIVAESREMRRILEIVKEIARTDITVLLTGESGVGKEVIARYIHKHSPRSNQPFVAINCAAITETLLEAELFGHEKGAFTGATERKPGKFELANKGTILLDEISEMAYRLQAKLLRVIQEKEIDRVGGTKPIPIDVRIIATTNKDLAEEVKKGNFREDLFYRINVFPIRIPPLRERSDDIIPLAEFFLKRLSNKMSKNFTITEDMKKFLLKKSWQGNVRELENFIYRSAVLSQDGILRLHEDEINLFEEEKPVKAGKLKDAERELIVDALKKTEGNRTKAAKILGISVRTLRNKINEYGLKDV